MADHRQCIYSMLGQNNHLKNSEIEKHFLQEGFKRHTIYDIIKSGEMGLSAGDLPRSGHPQKFQISKKCRY